MPRKWHRQRHRWPLTSIPNFEKKAKLPNFKVEINSLAPVQWAELLVYSFAGGSVCCLLLCESTNRKESIHIAYITGSLADSREKFGSALLHSTSVMWTSQILAWICFEHVQKHFRFLPVLLIHRVTPTWGKHTKDEQLVCTSISQSIGRLGIRKLSRKKYNQSKWTFRLIAWGLLVTGILFTWRTRKWLKLQKLNVWSWLSWIHWL